MRYPGCLSGLLLGPFVLGIAIDFIQMALQAATINDGESIVALLFIVPMGAMLGAMTGYAWGASTENAPGNVGSQCRAIGGIGAVTTIIVSIDTLGVSRADLPQAAAALMSLFGLPLLWSLALWWIGGRMARIALSAKPTDSFR